jgi:hypothetical protein
VIHLVGMAGARDTASGRGGDRGGPWAVTRWLTVGPCGSKKRGGVLQRKEPSLATEGARWFRNFDVLGFPP